MLERLLEAARLSCECSLDTLHSHRSYDKKFEKIEKIRLVRYGYYAAGGGQLRSCFELLSTPMKTMIILLKTAVI
jgi:hypothetical protein